MPDEVVESVVDEDLKQVLLVSITQQSKRITKLVKLEEEGAYNDRLYREFEALAKLIALHEGLDPVSAGSGITPAWVDTLDPEVARGVIRVVRQRHSKVGNG